MTLAVDIVGIAVMVVMVAVSITARFMSAPFVASVARTMVVTVSVSVAILIFAKATAIANAPATSTVAWRWNAAGVVLCSTPYADDDCHIRIIVVVNCNSGPER